MPDTEGAQGHEPERARGITAGELAESFRRVEHRAALIEEAERRYRRRSAEERLRLERRGGGPADLDEAWTELLSAAPAWVRDRLRQESAWSRALVGRVEEDAFDGMRPRDAGQRVALGLSEEERRHWRVVWRYRDALSPADRDQWDFFFDGAGRERPRTPSYLVLALTRSDRGIQRSARQDWDLPDECLRRLRLGQSSAPRENQTGAELTGSPKDRRAPGR